MVQVDELSILDNPLIKLKLETISLNNNSGLLYFKESESYYQALYKLEKKSLLPDVSFEYFRGGSNPQKNFLNGYQIGIKIPLLFSGNFSKIKASKIALQIIDEQKKNYQAKLSAEQNILMAKLQQYTEAINYYENQGEKLSQEIIKTANRSFKEGEIDFRNN